MTDTATTTTAATSDAATPAADPLTLDACPACGYSLRGLPNSGTCPECGRQYDDRFIVLEGRGRGRFAMTFDGTWRGAALGVFMLIVLAIMLRFRWWTWDPVNLFYAGAFVAYLGAQNLAWVFSPRAPRAQLWLCEAGFRQVLSTEGARRIDELYQYSRWLLVPFVVLIPLARAPTSLMAWAVTGAALGVYLVFALWADRCHRRRRAAELLPPVAGAPALMRWSGVNAIRISTQRERFRFQIWGDIWWGQIHVVRSAAHADIEISDDGPVRHALLPRIERWCSGATKLEVR